MALFTKPDDHAGSGIDKPQKRGLVEKVMDAVRPAPESTPAKAPAPPKPIAE